MAELIQNNARVRVSISDSVTLFAGSSAPATGGGITANSVDTLTNKTINSASNTLTIAQADVTNLGTQLDTAAVRSNTSAGLSLQNQSGTTLLNVGAGGGANATFSGNVSLGSTNKIINSAEPTAAQDLATKNYVDTNILPEQYALHKEAGSNTKASTNWQSTTTSNLTLSNQNFRYVPIYVAEDVTLTGVRWYQGTQGDYTADNENRIGLYTKSGNTMTLVASTANDGNLWKAASGEATKNFSSTYAASRGVYWIGFVFSRSAVVVAPQIAREDQRIPNSGFTFNSIGQLNSQTTLPASFDVTTASSITTTYLFELY